MFNDLVIKHN